MYPNRGYTPSPSPYTTRPPPPGHQRNRVACVNCRRRKIKCPNAGADKNLQQPCARCIKDGVPCEYVAIPSEDDASYEDQGPRAPRWVEPLDPESYARSSGSGRGAGRGASSGVSSYAPISHPNAGPGFAHTAYGQPSAQFTPDQGTIGEGWGYTNPGQFNNAQPQPGYPTTNTNMNPNVHYGQFPGGPNTVYPWSNSQSVGCLCASEPCVCGRRF